MRNPPSEWRRAVQLGGSAINIWQDGGKTYVEPDGEGEATLVTSAQRIQWILAAGSEILLNKLGGDSTLSFLMEQLSEGTPDVLRNTLKALREIGDPRAVEPLFKLLQGPDPYMQQHAAEALYGVDPQIVVNELNKLNKSGFLKGVAKLFQTQVGQRQKKLKRLALINAIIEGYRRDRVTEILEQANGRKNGRAQEAIRIRELFTGPTEDGLFDGDS